VRLRPGCCTGPSSSVGVSPHYDVVHKELDQLVSRLVSTLHPDRSEPELSGRPEMTTPRISLRANLNNEDDEGLNWALLRDAEHPEEIVEGALVVVGTERFWCWAKIRRVDQDGQVHFEQVEGNEATGVPQAS
jgi:hypothetical protein